MEQQRFGSPGGSLDPIQGATNDGPSSFGDSGGHSAADVAKEQGHRALDRLKENAVGKVEDQKTAALHQVEQLAHGLRRTGETLRQEGAEPFGRLASSAAENVDRLAGYLQRTDVEGFVRDFRSLARRHPSAVFGTALVAGVLVGRFLRSSRPVEREVTFTPDPLLLDEGGMNRSSFGSTGTGSSSRSWGQDGWNDLGSGPGSEPPAGGWT
jgi:hypothetical protein